MVMSPQVSWLFFKARAKCPYLGLIRAERPTRKNSQLAAAQKVALKMGGGCVARRLRPAPVFLLNVGEEKWQKENWSGMRPPTASPTGTALPAALFERNETTIIRETVH